MPGIVGIIDNEPNAEIEALLSKMISNVKHENWYTVDVFSDSTIGLGNICIPTTDQRFNKTIAEDDTFLVMIHGEIFSWGPVEQNIIAQNSIVSNADAILTLYRTKGLKFLEKANGSFIIVIWNKELNELVLANDRYGTLALYYCLNKKRLLFSPEQKALLLDKELTREIDFIPIASMLAFGSLIGDRTFLKNISVLSPGSIIRYKDGQVKISKYWNFSFSEEYHQKSEDDYIDEFLHHLRKAVELRASGPAKLGMGLSGGLDSRTVSGLLPKEKCSSVHTFTFGSNASGDVEVAKLLSAQLDTIHHTIKFRQEDFSETIQTLSNDMDFYPSITAYHSYASGIIKHQYADVELSGACGDSVTGQLNRLSGLFHASDLRLDQAQKASWEERLYHRMQQGGIHSNDSSFYGQMVLDLIKDGLRQEYHAVFAQNHSSYFQNIIQEMKFLEIDRRAVFPTCQQYGLQVRVRYPFLDYNFVDFMLSTPPALRNSQYLYKKVIRTRLPHVANIPHQLSGNPINENEKWSEIATISKFMFYKAARKITGRSFGPPITHDYFSNWIGNESKQVIENILLGPDSKSKNFFNVNWIKSELIKHSEGKSSYPWHILRLLTLEFFFRSLENQVY